MKQINKSKRVTIQIPIGSEIYDFLFDNDGLKSSKWEALNQIIKQLPKSKEDRAIKIFDNFLEQLCELYPEKKDSLEKLRPLVILQVIKGGYTLDGEKVGLSDDYFEELKKL